MPARGLPRLPVFLTVILFVVLFLDLSRGLKSKARPYLPQFHYGKPKLQLDHLSSRYATATRSFWAHSHGPLRGDTLLVSENGRYTLGWNRAQEFVVHSLSETAAPRAIWWSNDGVPYQGKRHGEITPRGIFVNRHKFPKKLNGKEFVDTFSTAQFPDCRIEPEEGMEALLYLTDWGALRIYHVLKDALPAIEGLHALNNQEGVNLLHPVCEFYPGERSVEDRSNMGRLAVIMTGAMRTYEKTCHSLNKKIFDQWPGSGGVDIFVATLEDDLNWDKVEDNLRECFGDKFKSLTRASDNSVAFNGSSQVIGECSKSRLSAETILNMQFTIYRGYQMMLDYMMRNHTSYDYVLKIRPDHWAWGDEMPPFEPLEMDTILMPKPYFDYVNFFGTHLNTSHQAPSDQIAFGRFLPMSTYLSLYASYQTIVPAAQANNVDERVIYQPCGMNPASPCPGKPAQHAPCWIEGLTGYWAKLNGLKIKLDYRWKISLERDSGQKGWQPRYPWNLDQGSRFVETADD